MSSIPLKDAEDATYRPDTFTRMEDGDLVHMQAMVPVDPATGDPLDLATEATLAALKGVADTLATAAAAIQSAVEALNGKTTVVNTGAIGGTVALDGPSLAALETISVANFPATQPVSAAALPLPAGAATDASVAAVTAAINAQAAVTQPVDASFAAVVLSLLEYMANPPWLDTTTGRLRVLLDALGGAQTLGTITTVSTVTTCSTLTSVSQIAGVPANGLVYDVMDALWAHAIRPRIT